MLEARLPVLCFFGQDESDTLCRDLAPPALVHQMPGGHHFGGRYAEIAGRILAAVPAAPSPTSPAP
jgi:type IV secretory pathway VirJ component